MGHTIPFDDLSYGTEMSARFKSCRVEIDEGYNQRAKRKNGAQQQWRLQWDNINEDIAERLRNFFEDLQAVEIIDWRPYNQPSTLKWTADGFSSRPSGYRVATCSVTLTQEFDL